MAQITQKMLDGTFDIQVIKAKENLELVGYYHNIISSLFLDNREDILSKNKCMILSNIDNLLETVNKVKEFTEKYLKEEL